MLNSPNSSAKLNNRYAKERPLAIVNLDIGQTITIYPSDNIEDVVLRFCEDHGLDEQCVEYLVECISTQIETKRGKENQQQVKPPSFGGKDLMLESFGSPNLQTYNYHSRDVFSNTDSKQTTNQSLSEKNEQQLATQYERWHQIINTNDKNSCNNLVNPEQYYPNPKRQQRKSPRVFEKLYQEGLEQHRLRSEISELYKQQKSERELREATFKPQISQISKIIAEQRGRGEKPKKNPQVERYTFKPTLSPNTMRLMEFTKQRSKSPIHSKLYDEGVQQDKLKQQWAKEMFQQKHPFQRQKSPKQSFKQQQDTVKRLMQEQQERVQKNELARKRSQSPFDNKTGQQLFHPRIHKDQFHRKVSERIDEEDKVLAQCLSQRITRQHSRQVSKSHLPTSPSPNRSSSNLAFEVCCRKVFEQLDSDSDGLISYDKLDITTISGSVLELICNVLYTMDDNYLTYNLREFTEACSRAGIAEQLVRETSIPIKGSYRNLF